MRIPRCFRAPMLLIAVLAAAAGTPSASAQPAGAPLDELVSYAAENERSTQNRATRTITTTLDIIVTNVSEERLAGVLHLVFTLAGGQVQMPGALGGVGVAPWQKYYLDLAAGLADGALDSGESVRRTVTFVRPSVVRFTYQVSLYGEVAQAGARPPELLVDPLEVTVTEGETLRIMASASDPDSEPLVLTALPRVANAAFEANRGLAPRGMFTMTPDHTQAGTWQVAIRAVDPLGLSDQETVTIHVLEQNRPPTLTAPTPLSVDEGKVLTIPLTAADPDSNSLLLTAGPIPANAIFSPAAASITFAPDYEQAGVYPIVCHASDGQAQCAPVTIMVTVNDVPTGDPAQPHELVLEVDPVQNPSFLPSVRVTGRVNTSSEPVVTPRQTSTLISGLDPSGGTQGERVEVVLTGAPGAYAPHFEQGRSVADFGAGITVEALEVTGPAAARARVLIAPAAATGARMVRVVTGSETAVAVVAFNVTLGRGRIVGRVIDKETTQPLEGVRVALQGSGRSALTGADGAFDLIDLPAAAGQLIFNAQDHDLLAMGVTPPAGQTLDLGTVELQPNVYDPAAAPAISVLSVLGRGITDPGSVPDREAMEQAIVDTLLLVGDSEAGVLDEYGNQLNPKIEGAGYVSLDPKGIDVLADKMERGESVSLHDLIWAFNFGFEWSNGHPMKLDDWIGMLQEQVDAAWQDPHSTESLMAILMFNEDRQLSLDPPQLSPFTRLNPVQAWLFASGLYTYIFTREDGEQNCPSKFWRNAFWMKSDYLQARVAEGANKTLLYLNGVSMMPTLLNLLGSSTMLAQDLTYLFVNFKQGVIVPDPPRLLGATVSQRPMGGQFVTISFKINTAQEPASNFYTLYRFEPRSQKRTAVTRWQPPADMAAFDLAWEVTDEEPPVGQVFYSMATTKFLKPLADFSEYELEQMKPWWESPLLGADPYIVAKTTKSLMSDYSEPKVVTVGPAGIDASIDDIELNPADGNLYYGDKQNQAIYQIENGGLGSRYPFVSTGFKLPGQQGLAIDRSGNVYSENSASDTNFGGRIFRYQLGTGSREFCGSLNYFSQVLMYAQPVSAGAMTMGIDNRLYQVEQLSQRIKQVDVNATYDPYRRVGQDWAVIPENVAGTAFDIESDFGGNLYLLYFGVQKPARTKFFAETSTYLETPMYQGQRTLPTYDGGLITLYGITHVEMVANVFDGNSLPIGNALVNFSTDYGRFVTSSSVRTDENGRAAATLRVVVPRSDWPKKEVKVTANVASLAADYECKIEIIDNYKRLQERYMQEIPRGIIMRDGTYYTSGMGGFGPPGVINNILQAGYSMAGEKRADEIGNFVCGGYQGQVLEWLNKIRLSEDEEQFLFNGLEYGPISAFNFGHHAVVVYPNDKNWWDPESLAFDPWLYQEPVLTPWPEWNALMIATGTPDFCAYGLAKAYPIVGGEFYPGPAGAKPVPQPPYKAVVEFKPSGDPWANKADVQVVRPAGTMTIPSTGAPETTIPGSHIYVPPGNQYGSIALPEGPSNMTFRPPQSGMFDLTVWYGNGTVARYLNVPGAAMQAFRLNIVPDAPEPNLLPEGGDPIPPTGGMGPVPMIIDIQPPSAHPGETLTVTLTGGGTRFLEGVSTIGFGPVIQVNSFTVLGPTSAEANITIPADAEAGEYAPSIVSPGERAMARDTFKVVVE